MMKNKNLNYSIQIILALFVFCLSFVYLPLSVKAASEVEITDIDYDELTISLKKSADGKAILYSDANKKVWETVEDVADPDKSGNVIMDISWVSNAKNYELNFKFDEKDSPITKVVLPDANRTLKVKFLKDSGKLEFENERNAAAFQWKKSTGYEWSDPIALSQPKSFLNEIDTLREKGATISVRIAAENGTSATKVGKRQSKEVKVKVTKRPNAPNVKVNGAKFNLNTTDKMEYQVGNDWVSATKKMLLKDISANAFKEDITVAFRFAAVKGKKPYSKTQFLFIPKQIAAPTFGASGSDVNYRYTVKGAKNNVKQITLNFTKASTTTPYEYRIIKPGEVLDYEKGSWRTVKKTTDINLNQRAVPDNSKIYVRVKTQKATKTQDFQLASADTSITVKHP